MRCCGGDSDKLVRCRVSERVRIVERQRRVWRMDVREGSEKTEVQRAQDPGTEFRNKADQVVPLMRLARGSSRSWRMRVRVEKK